jgi:hypothetical protein
MIEVPPNPLLAGTSTVSSEIAASPDKRCRMCSAIKSGGISKFPPLFMRTTAARSAFGLKKILLVKPAVAPLCR